MRSRAGWCGTRTRGPLTWRCDTPAAAGARPGPRRTQGGTPRRRRGPRSPPARSPAPPPPYPAGRGARGSETPRRSTLRRRRPPGPARDIVGVTSGGVRIVGSIVTTARAASAPPSWLLSSRRCTRRRGSNVPNASDGTRRRCLTSARVSNKNTLIKRARKNPARTKAPLCLVAGVFLPSPIAPQGRPRKRRTPPAPPPSPDHASSSDENASRRLETADTCAVSSSTPRTPP